MGISLNYIYESYQGLNRDENKDSIQIIEKDNYALFIVFDGISSSENATKAIDAIKQFVSRNEHLFKKEKVFELGNLMFEANKFLLISGIEKGLTTYAIIYIDKINNIKSCKISNLGDTRIYSIEKQHMPQLTIDHRPINEPNIVTKYLGMLQYDYKDFKETEYEIHEGTRLLICSDGFYEFIEKSQIEMHEILNTKRIGIIKNSLRKMISQYNQDDASYIFIEINYV